MSPRFAGKVAFVTGSAMGLGRSFAEAFAREGAAVAVADIDGAGAEETAAAIAKSGGKALALPCDVGSRQSVQAAVDETVVRLGGLDLLVNNAARHLKRYNEPFSVLTEEEIRGLFDVNVLGVLHCTLAAKQALAANGGGAVVNIASAAGFLSSTPYGVTKLAVRGLTIALANELSPTGTRVNAVAPTLTPTDAVKAEFSDEDFDRSVASRQLVRRRATLDDVTNTVLFLCSDEASFITGETIRVTGGASLAI